MRATRAASRALLHQHQNDPNHHPETTIRSLANEVLLEIFDSFRQTFQRESDYERAWNSKEGWFKLAHVCREWRQIILTSPSRLHLRLLVTEHRSGRATAIRHLPPLPIHVDYGSGAWFAKTQIRLISALKYPDRVCGITFKMSYRQSKHVSKLLTAINQPFPALESLELHCSRSIGLQSPPPFLTAQTHLRSLKFVGTINVFYRLLPYITSLVDLTLLHYTSLISPGDTLLLFHLQGLSSLRRLGVKTGPGEMIVGLGERKDVILPTLISFSFAGHIDLLDLLMAGLTAPSLQELRISLYDFRAISPPTNLTSFIFNSGRRVFSAQISASGHGINLVMSAHSHSTNDPPFKIIASKMCSVLLMADLFSETLATVDDVFLASPFSLEGLPTSSPDSFPSYKLFTPFRGAKVLRVSPGLEPKVGKALSPDLLPALEEIELNATTPLCAPIRIDEKEMVSALEPFKRFVDARQQAGHP